MFFNNRGFTPSNRLREMHFESFTCRLCLPGSLPRHRWPSANMQIVSDTRYAGSIHRSPTSWCRSIIISEAYNGSRLDRPYSNGTQRIYRHTLHFNWWTKQSLRRYLHSSSGQHRQIKRSIIVPSRHCRVSRLGLCRHRTNQRSIIVPSPGNCRVSRLGCSYSVAHYRCVSTAAAAFDQSATP